MRSRRQRPELPSLSGSGRVGCPSRILMQPLGDNNDGVPERLGIRQPGPVQLTVPDDRPAHLGLKNGAFASSSGISFSAKVRLCVVEQRRGRCATGTRILRERTKSADQAVQYVVVAPSIDTPRADGAGQRLIDLKRLLAKEDCLHVFRTQVLASGIQDVFLRNGANSLHVRRRPIVIAVAQSFQCKTAG